MILVLLRYLHFICIFIDAVMSELLTLTFQSDIVKIWTHIKLSPPSIEKRTPKPSEIYTLRHHCLSITDIQPSLQTPFILYPFAKICKKWRMCYFFYKRLEEEEQKAFSECWKRKRYSYLYQYKTSVPDGNWLTRC